jgi:hypothetical protein
MHLPSDRDDASLHPLDPEAAIRTIMEAGPHPKESEKPAKPRKPRAAG